MKISVHKMIQEVPYYPKAMMYGQDDGWVTLSSNENPLPPSPRALSNILDALFSANRYPGGEAELKAAIAEKCGLEAEEVLIGNGSNEIIEMSLRTMKDDRRTKVIISEPSFAFYKIAAQIYGYEVCKVPLVNMRVDLGTIREQVDDRTRLVFLNNPNNPTGTIFEEEAFASFLREGPPEMLVVVDEAYAEFAVNRRFPHSIGYIHDFPVLVLRTFSKAYGLAGLRVGYGIADGPLISFLERTKQPFSVNLLALAGARGALDDESYLKKVLDHNEKGKRFMYGELAGLNLEYVPTEANFIMMRIGDQAESVTKRLFEQKIVVRWMGAYGLPDYVRVTVGRMEENALFIETLKRIL
jgi:histidinol-phosphate aminotransferase